MSDAMVFVPKGQSVTVDLSKITAWVPPLFDACTGAATGITGSFVTTASTTVRPGYQRG